MPKVSVIIPTYNRGEFIGKAIDSVLKQTYTNYEIIVVDDGSTDDTRKVVKSYGKKVRYIYQENKGPSAARNRGINAAKGEYVAFLDSDDQFLPHKLQIQMNFIKKHSKCRFLYSWYYNTNKKGKNTKLRKPLATKNREFLQHSLYRRKFTIRTSTVVIQKRIFNKVGKFNERYLYSQDWDMWLRIVHIYRGYCIKKPLAKYGLHDNNRSSKSVKTYHPEIKKNTLNLYGWSKKKLKKLDKQYKNK